MLRWLAVLLFPIVAQADQVEDLLQEGRLGAAVPVAEKAARANPADVDAQERWIDLMHALQTPGIAVAYYAERAEKTPTADAWYLVGRAHAAPAQSLEAYDKALAINDKHARSYMGLGALHRVADKAERAVEAYKRALELDDSLAEAWGALLALYVANGDREPAQRLAELAILNVPSLVEPYLVYAMLVPEHAEVTLKKGLSQTPDARLHASLAELRLQQGRSAAALEHAEAALKLRPAMAGAQLAAMFARSMVKGTLDVAAYQKLVELHDAEDPASTVAAYDALVRSHPRTPLTWMGRARARAATGNPAGARADLERAVTLEPVEVEAQAALGMMLVGSDDARALRLLQEPADQRLHDATLQVGYARAAQAAGQLAKAVERLDQAVRVHPYNVEVVLRHAALVSEAGDKERAYLLLADAAGRIPDVRIPMARAAAARETGRLDESLAIYNRLYEITRKRFFSEAAESVRAEIDAKR